MPSAASRTRTCRPPGRLDLGLLGGDLHGQAGHEVVHPPHPQPLDRLRRRAARRPRPARPGRGARSPRRPSGPCPPPAPRRRTAPARDRAPGAGPAPGAAGGGPGTATPGTPPPPRPRSSARPARAPRRRPRSAPQPARARIRVWPRFPRGCGILRDLRRGNGVEQLPLTYRKGVEHVFDSSATIMEWEAENRKDQGDHAPTATTKSMASSLVLSGPPGLAEREERGSQVVDATTSRRRP